MGSCTGIPKIKKNIFISSNNSAMLDKLDKKNPNETLTAPDAPIDTCENYSIISSDSSKELTIELFADREPILIPIFIKKQQTVNIIVNGIWRINKEYGFTTFKGCMYKKYQNNNYGQLLCKVQGGKTWVVDKQSFFFMSDSNGKLMFFPNCDLDEVEPLGFLTIKIIGGIKQLSQKDINKYTDYPDLPLFSPEEYSYLSKEEFDVFEMINKVRTSPKHFAELFLIKENPSHQELYTFLQTFSSLPPLTLNQDLTSAAKKHCIYLGDKGLSGHIGSNNKINIRERVVEMYKNRFDYFGENILFGKKRDYSIVIDMLIDKNIKDKKNRINLLNEKFNEIGICIGKHIVYKWCCVILLNDSS